ncbi:MAG: GreA/GreB family elongation factor [Anaerolineales bacterium]|nr:GreA/GreB family elongation factor [Anaerolineales bacterium]
MDTQAFKIERNSQVLVELVDASGEAEQRQFTLVASEQADLRSGLLDEMAPLGQALLGRCAGEVLPYRQGDLRQVRILRVEQGEDSVSAEAAEKRRAAVQQAEAQSEITSQMIFANASGSKWGAYDVDLDHLLQDDEQDKDEKA